MWTQTFKLEWFISKWLRHKCIGARVKYGLAYYSITIFQQCRIIEEFPDCECFSEGLAVVAATHSWKLWTDMIKGVTFISPLFWTDAQRHDQLHVHGACIVYHRYTHQCSLLASHTLAHPYACTQLHTVHSGQVKHEVSYKYNFLKIGVY